MKKTIIFLVTLVMLMGLSLPVFAASETYQVKEMGLEIQVPDSYFVLTRDTPATDSIFTLLNGTTYDAVMTQFKNGNIYLNAITFERSEEIVVTMTEISLADFSTISDAVLNTLASALAPEYASYGIQVSKQELYQHAQTKFIRLYFYDTNSKVYGLQYYTVYDGKAMNFTMRSSEGSLLPIQEQNITSIVDSIRFTDLSDEPMPTEEVTTPPAPTETEPPAPTETAPPATEPDPSVPASSVPATTGAAAGTNSGVTPQLMPGTQTSSGMDSTTLWILIGAGALAVVIIVVLIILLCRKKKAPAPKAPAAAPVTPAPAAPAHAAPAPAVPVTQIPAEQIPVEQMPVEQMPVEQMPAEQIPAEQIPVEQMPAEQIPVEQIPVEQIPAEQIPAEQIPAEQIPVEQMPAEQIPAEQMPAEQIPVTPIPDTQYQSPVNYCRNCGAEIPEGSRFCQNCGALTSTQ